MRLLGYTRVDGVIQDACLQRDALESAGVDPHDVYSDGDDVSDLTALKRLMDNARSGDSVVVWRVDRLGRSAGEVLNTVARLSEGGLNLRSVQDGLDTRTTQGRVVVDLLAGLADYDRHLADEGIAAGMASSPKRGRRLGRPPLDPVGIRDKIRAVEEARTRGMTAADAAQLVGWSRATFYRHQQEHRSQR